MNKKYIITINENCTIIFDCVSDGTKCIYNADEIKKVSEEKVIFNNGEYYNTSNILNTNNLLTTLNNCIMQIGNNSSKENKLYAQHCADFNLNVCENITAQGLIDQLVATGATYGDGTTLVAATDIIHFAQIGLKDVNGEGDVWNGLDAFEPKVATACDAKIIASGGEYDLDAGGISPTYTGATIAGVKQPNSLQSIEVVEGSIVTVALTVCQPNCYEVQKNEDGTVSPVAGGGK